MFIKVLNITLVCVGGLKEEFWKAACAEYIKRIGLWAKIKTVEIDEVRLPDDPSQALIISALDREADKIHKKLPANAFVTLLCVEGMQMDSQEFAQTVSRRMQLNGNFVFVIGGSYGLAQKLKDLAHLKLSLSAMTFPHMMARVLLVEQIYRALSIVSGGKYHK